MGQVTLKNIHKRFGDVEVIRGIDLDVRDGEFMVLVGPSGCGKSTVLRMIAGLESITSGELLIDGVRANDVHPAERGCAMVFQSYALYPHMTVAENMAFALKMTGVPRREREAQVAQTAEILRLSEYLKRYPKELSGGQRQRVAIGRAIVRKPKVFLFDEPLSNLDAALRVNMRIELGRLHEQLGTTMIYVTHDQVEAMTLGQRIAVFNHGGVEQLGSPLSLYEQPANEFVAGFLGSPRINLVPRPSASAPPAHRAYWDALWSGRTGGAPEPAQRAGLRPEHLQLVDSTEGVACEVVMAEHLGDASIVHLRVDGIDALQTAKLGAARQRVASGERVGLKPDPQWALGFDAAGQRVA